MTKTLEDIYWDNIEKGMRIMNRGKLLVNLRRYCK